MKHSRPKIEDSPEQTAPLSDDDRLELLIETARKSGISLDALLPLLDGVGDTDLARVAGNAEASGVQRRRVWNGADDDPERLLNLAIGTAAALLALDERLRISDPIIGAMMDMHTELQKLLISIQRILFLDGNVGRAGCAK